MMESGLSGNAEKVYKSMKDMNAVGDKGAVSVERITMSSKLAKAFVLNALQELQQKKLIKRRAGEKTAGYYIIEGK